MRKLMDKIDRFCYTHPNFGIPRLMMYIVIGNVAVFLLQSMDTTGMLPWVLTFSPEMIFKHGQIWRLITFVFVPESTGLWLVLWLYLYYFIGNELENRWGSAKFTVFYVTGMALSGLYAILMWWITGRDVSATAYYVNMSMFFAYATLYPDTQLLFMFIIPVKIKWLALLDLLLFAAGVLGGTFPQNLLPVIALLNYVLFFGDWLLQMFTPERKEQRRTKANFKNEQRRIHQEMKSKPYSRKCEVCGRTDTAYPDLEFRFCSRCEGYHCYCMDHINDHVHKNS